jgi:excisionase family DNA binding protein
MTDDTLPLLCEDPLGELPRRSLYTVEEVAAYFRVAPSTVYRWIDALELDAVKVGGVIRIPRSAIQKKLSHTSE